MKKYLILTALFICTVSTLSFAKTEKRHYPDGTLQSVVHFNSKHKRNGPYKVYWTNRQLMEQGVYKNGVIVGTPKKYSIDGIRLQ